jgi:hypothetical protein
MALLGVSALEKALLLEAAPLLGPSSSSSFPGKISLPFSPSPSLQNSLSLFSLFIIIFFSIKAPFGNAAAAAFPKKFEYFCFFAKI